MMDGYGVHNVCDEFGYEGWWLRGERCGKGTFRDRYGVVCRGEFRNGDACGRCDYSKKGSRFVGEYSKNHKSGYGEFYEYQGEVVHRVYRGPHTIMGKQGEVVCINNEMDIAELLVFEEGELV